MRWHSVASLCLITMPFAPVAPRAADAAQQQVAGHTCAALRSAAQTIPGGGPMPLPSYPSPKQEGDAANRALANVAFVYCNALAGIALTACGEPAQARRIAPNWERETVSRLGWIARTAELDHPNQALVISAPAC